MKKIVVSSQKGGSGKTTLTAHLAVEAGRNGDGPAWLIDTDKQGTLSRWHQRRENDQPQRLDVTYSRLVADLAKLQGTYCFIDTAPTISEQNEAIISIADFVLIPVRPSPTDLWSVAETVALVKKAAKPFLFVVMQAKTQANITAQAVAVLSKDGRVAESFITDRVAYAAAMTGGQTAPELSSRNPAAQEMKLLWKEIKSCFNEKMKSRKKVSRG